MQYNSMCIIIMILFSSTRRVACFRRMTLSNITDENGTVYADMFDNRRKTFSNFYEFSPRADNLIQLVLHLSKIYDVASFVIIQSKTKFVNRLDNVKIKSTSCHGQMNDNCCVVHVSHVKMVPNIHKSRIIIRRKALVGNIMTNLPIGKMQMAHLQWTSKSIQILELQIQADDMFYQKLETFGYSGVLLSKAIIKNQGENCLPWLVDGLILQLPKSYLGESIKTNARDCKMFENCQLISIQLEKPTQIHSIIIVDGSGEMVKWKNMYTTLKTGEDQKMKCAVKWMESCKEDGLPPNRYKYIFCEKHSSEKYHVVVDIEVEVDSVVGGLVLDELAIFQTYIKRPSNCSKLNKDNLPTWFNTANSLPNIIASTSVYAKPSTTSTSTTTHSKPSLIKTTKLNTISTTPATITSYSTTNTPPTTTTSALHTTTTILPHTTSTTPSTLPFTITTTNTIPPRITTTTTHILPTTPITAARQSTSPNTLITPANTLITPTSSSITPTPTAIPTPQVPTPSTGHTSTVSSQGLPESTTSEHETSQGARSLLPTNNTLASTPTSSPTVSTQSKLTTTENVRSLATSYGLRHTTISSPPSTINASFLSTTIHSTRDLLSKSKSMGVTIPPSSTQSEKSADTNITISGTSLSSTFVASERKTSPSPTNNKISNSDRTTAKISPEIQHKAGVNDTSMTLPNKQSYISQVSTGKPTYPTYKTTLNSEEYLPNLTESGFSFWEFISNGYFIFFVVIFSLGMLLSRFLYFFYINDDEEEEEESSFGVRDMNDLND